MSGRDLPAVARPGGTGESLTRAGARVHVFPAGHVSGCVPAVLDRVVSVAARG